MFRTAWIACGLGCLLLTLPADGQTIGGQGVDPGRFKTHVTDADIDREQDVEWCNGQTQPAKTASDPKLNLIWTDRSYTHHAGLQFGDSRDPGPRHLRLGFKRPLPVGSVLVAGKAALSVLKPGVTGPGDPADDSQWTPAQRLDGRAVTTDESRGITVWVLPPRTQTRALRFTRTPQPTESHYAGWLGGVYVLADRYADVSGQARVETSANAKESGKITDGQFNSWNCWANGDKGQDEVVSPAHPVWIQFSFPAPVTLSGLQAFACGADTVRISALPDSFTGPLAQAGDADWKLVTTAGNIWDFYPAQLRPSFFDLQREVKVRAVRMTMIAPHRMERIHPHMKSRPAGGKRVWLDELQALAPLGGQPLESAVLPEWEKHDAHPPIPVAFQLDQPGSVTLVIEDGQGRRIRNLISQTPYPAGDNVAWWDGLDDLGRDVDAANHGLYHVPGTLVTPGSYTVRGLVAPALELTYEVSMDNAGTPPWPTPDNRGGWGTNHTPPSCVAVVPAERSSLNTELVFIGSYVAEGGHGLFWVNLDGQKQGGKHWLGGHWTGAQSLASDAGSQPVAGHAVYVASGFQGEVRFVALDSNLGEVILGKYQLRAPAKGMPDDPSMVGDLAAHNGLLVAAMPRLNGLWLLDAAAKKLLGQVPLDQPRTVAFRPDGTLLASSGNALVQIRLDRAAIGAMPAAENPKQLPEIASVSKTALPMTLDKPFGLAVLPDGNVAVSERGSHHQVRVYAPSGKVVRTIGKPGAPRAGQYDPLHMNNPQGVGVDSRGRFWVAENHSQPKRVSLWDSAGKLDRAWYGPSRYGGGGTLDPFDRTRFYNAGMAFKIDWKTGDVAVERILLLSARGHDDEDAARSQFPSNQHHADGMPEQAHRVAGRRFFSNWHNGSPTNGTSTVAIWEDKGDQLLPVAALGNAYGWWVLESEPFRSLWPEGTPARNQHQQPVYFTWQDANGNGVCEPAETVLRKGKSAGVTVQPDLSFVTAIDTQIVQFKPVVSATEVRYDFDKPTVLMENAQRNVSSGGSTYMLMPDNRVIAYPPSKPYSNYSLGGGPAGAEPNWSYPNMWPGLHPSHTAAVPTFPGMVIGPTRLIGLPVTPRGSDIGPIWFLNANMGNIYVFTSDGLFVAELFHDSRTAERWKMPVAQRGTRVDHLTLGDETFWPTVAQVQDDGDIFLCTGAASTSSLVQVHGLEKARRIKPQTLTVSADMVRQCLSWQVTAEEARRALQAPSRLAVPVSAPAVTVDGKLDDWAGAAWATIDQRGTRAKFNSDSKRYDVDAALRVSGDTLYVAWRTTEKNLLNNSGEIELAPFKTGGGLDLMIATDPQAQPDRKDPIAGDQRLFITRRGKDAKSATTWAVLYQAVVPGTAQRDRVPFRSPFRGISFDKVTDVSSQVQLAQDQGNYEVAIPLALLGLAPRAGMAVKGDLGILRGGAGSTSQRVYWSNKATAIAADVPSEAELLPRLWGTFVFE